MDEMPRYAGYVEITAPDPACHAMVIAALGLPQIEWPGPLYVSGYGVNDADEVRAIVDRLRASGLHDGRLAMIVRTSPVVVEGR